MTPLTLAQMQSLVLRMLGNMQSTDTFYDLVFPASGAESMSVINQAANRLIRTAVGANRNGFSLFPELQNTFDLGPTVAGTNYLTRPVDCIAIQNVKSSHSATAPSWAVTQEYPVNYVPPTTFGTLTKDAANTRPDYVNIYTLIAKLVYIYPTPTAAYIDYLRLYGLQAESNLVGSTDTLRMDPEFHPLVVKLAASDLADKMGYGDGGKSWYMEVVNELQATLNVGDEQIPAGAVDLTDIMPTFGGMSGGGGGGWV